MNVPYTFSAFIDLWSLTLSFVFSLTTFIGFPLSFIFCWTIFQVLFLSNSFFIFVSYFFLFIFPSLFRFSFLLNSFSLPVLGLVWIEHLFLGLFETLRLLVFPSLSIFFHTFLLSPPSSRSRILTRFRFLRIRLVTRWKHCMEDNIFL